MDYKILDNSIVICSNQMKKNILNQNLLLNIKIMTINELIKKLTFDYDEKAIFHIMQKENIKYSLAQMYLDNIYYIENKEYESPKLKKLVEIKESVKELLIYDELFKNDIFAINSCALLILFHNVLPPSIKDVFWPVLLYAFTKSVEEIVYF